MLDGIEKRAANGLVLRLGSRSVRAGNIAMPSTGESWNQFELLEPLGRGGMGQVFLAQDKTLDRHVALKFLPEKLEDDDMARERFLREAKSAAALDHPYICKIYEIGEADDKAYIAMEYVEGVTLQEKVGAGPLRLPELLEIGTEIAEAVDAAHKKGIVHRDLKSPNIMVTRDGHIKVLDFGLAKKIALESGRGETAAESLTAHDVTPGTVIYMSPEQVKGERIDGRTDIFSLGVVLYELATGKLPFEEQTSGSTYDAILNRDPLPPTSINPDVPAELERIILKALEKDRDHRYQTAREVGVDLRRMRRPTVDSAPMYVTRSSGQLTIPGTPNRWVVWAIMTVVIALVASAAWFRPWVSGPSINSLAVLPFDNVQNNPEVDYLADGIPESLINRLSNVQDLQVMARSTAFRYRDGDVDPRAAGEELGVGAVLTGRVQQRLGRLNVQAELVDVESGTQLWGEQYSRQITDLLSVQNDIAREISDALRLELSGSELDELAREDTESSKAYQAYLKGRFFLSRRTQPDIQKAVAAFEEAKAIDPTFALASAGLGDSYIVLGAQWYGVDPENPPATALAKARAAAREALELDPDLAEAYVTRAYIEFLHDWDWQASEADFLKALELDSSYVVAHQWYSEYLAAMGRHGDSIAASQRAVELEPTSALQLRELANSYRHAGRYREAVVELLKADELDYSHPTTMFYLTASYWHLGAFDELIVAAYRWDERWGRFYELLVQNEPDEALRSLDSFAEHELNDLSWIHCYLAAGEEERAIERLEASFERRYASLPSIVSDAMLAPIAEEPRVVDVRRKMGL